MNPEEETDKEKNSSSNATELENWEFPDGKRMGLNLDN